MPMSLVFEIFRRVSSHRKKFPKLSQNPLAKWSIFVPEQDFFTRPVKVQLLERNGAVGSYSHCTGSISTTLRFILKYSMAQDKDTNEELHWAAVITTV